MPVNFICCFVGSQLPGDEVRVEELTRRQKAGARAWRSLAVCCAASFCYFPCHNLCLTWVRWASGMQDTAKHAAGRARFAQARAEKETQTSARCLEGYIASSAASQPVAATETCAADASPLSGVAPKPAAALQSTPPRATATAASAAASAFAAASSPSARGSTSAQKVQQPHTMPASLASTLACHHSTELDTPERATPSLALPSSNLSDSPIASVRTAPPPMPSLGAFGAPVVPSSGRLPPLPPHHGSAMPGRPGGGLSPIPSNVTAGRQSGSGFLESASRQLARAAAPLPCASYSMSSSPQVLAGGSHGDPDQEEYDDAGDRTSVASSVGGLVPAGGRSSATGARAFSAAGVELASVRTVRLPRGLRSPRTSNRALLTRQRTPYALRRFMGGQMVGPRELLDLPAAPSPAAGTGVGSTTGHGAASPARAATPSYANGGTSFRTIATAAAAASAAGRRMHTHSGAAPLDAELDAAALLDRNSAAAAPGSARAAVSAAARSAAIARQTAVRFGVRPLDPGAPAPGPEASVLSPRTTAPALLARQATPCPLRWGRLEDSWDGASEAPLSHTLSNTFSHTYSNVMNAVSEHGAPPTFDGGVDVFRYAGRSRAGGVGTIGGGNGSSMPGGGGAGGGGVYLGENGDRLSAGGVRGFSRGERFRTMVPFHVHVNVIFVTGPFENFRAHVHLLPTFLLATHSRQHPQWPTAIIRRWRGRNRRRPGRSPAAPAPRPARQRVSGQVTSQLRLLRYEPGSNRARRGRGRHRRRCWRRPVAAGGGVATHGRRRRSWRLRRQHAYSPRPAAQLGWQRGPGLGDAGPKVRTPSGRRSGAAAAGCAGCAVMLVMRYRSASTSCGCPDPCCLPCPQGTDRSNRRTRRARQHRNAHRLHWCRRSRRPGRPGHPHAAALRRRLCG